MNYFAIVFGLAAASASAADLAPKKLECFFTEPFFTLKLDTKKSQLTRIEPDWQDENGGKEVTTIVAKDLKISTNLINKTYQLKAKTKAGKTLLTATLNYSGNNGMSDLVSPFAAEYQHGGLAHKLYGACASETGGTYSDFEEFNPYRQFMQDVGRAVGLCYNRALSTWTDGPSQYLPAQTVFYTLYAREIPTGEPGDVSQTFASAEGQQLMELAQKTKIPAEDGAGLNRLRQAQWDYCDYYSSRLNERLENLSP